ncbi:hypothetical protein HBI56_220070 [Parastagonospora nodorum]|uniref:RanBP2-type domain-containing protein n=1 Tax=Phaeosphaeria nodorum (strain SN15 / ATCC MYA-4574 / FGSC 10173) TaxID=321614 RepID=A0A7U2HWA8_PHANO|nr:hypothetical protein HBH56_006920 [Parastagonospora nodorum]QRC90507.1 hypothetical protein JI435_425520 [Parastagonospora nodorum SN15]KAH3922159.1 hypothetical protein HBH54_228860 [Parastagonospora nodorum]KAH3940217.1 hypothetical protein HBH53_220280 [Parastagonospora nodorum]KAH3986811.1 hypothetical protein HBH51_016060 [Parastagonospora nodorum]
MAKSNPAATRNGDWICTSCQATNFTANSEQHCLSCGHYQASYSTSPSGYQQSTHLHRVYEADHRPAYELQHTAMNDGYELWHCYECDADNPDWHTEQCPVCGTPRPEQSRMSSTPMNTLGGAGSPAEGIWECSNCGAVNSAMHWNQCGECAFLN